MKSTSWNSSAVVVLLSTMALLAFWLLDPGRLLRMESDQPVRLKPDIPEPRRVSEEGVHEYRVALEAGQFVQVVAEQRGVDVTLRLLDPDGTVLIEVDSPNGFEGHESASFVADEAQDLRVQVVVNNPEAEPGEYEMRIERRAAVPEDRTRVQAERAFAEGERLRREERWADALGLYEKAAALRRSIGDKAGEGLALYRTGWMHHQLERWSRSVDFFDRALPLLREVKDRTSEGNLLNRRGQALRSLGRYDEALVSHSDAVAIGRETDDTDLETAALNNLGLVYSWSGRTQEAADAFDAALVLWRRLGNKRQEIRTLLNLGGLYLEQDRREDARDTYEEARVLAEGNGDRQSLAVALSNLGEIDHREQQLGEARQKLEKALALRRELQDRWGEAVTLNSLGAALLKDGELDQAKDSYETALGIFRELGDRSSQASALSGLGRYEHARGAHREALQRHQQALEGFEQLEDRVGMALAHFGCSRALANLGDLESARQHLERSLDFVESLRSESRSLNLRTSFFASKQHYWDLYVDVLIQLHQKYPLAGYDALAFQAGERRRFRSLLEALAGFRKQIQSGVPADLAARESELEQELDGIERRRMAAAESEGESLKFQDLEREFRTVLAELDRVQAKMLQDSRRHKELVQPKIPTLEEVQSRLLAPGTLLLAFSLGEERSFLWTVSRQSFDVHVLAERQQIEAAVERLQELLVRRGASAREPRERAAAELAELVLAPAARAIGGANRLVIIADGALLRIPFAALPEPGREGRPLMVEHEIVYLPSATVLYTLQERSRPQALRTSSHRVAVIADPVFSTDDPRVSGASRGEASLPGDLWRSLRDLGLSDLERLPYTRREAEEILKHLKEEERFAAFGFDAVRELVTGQQLKTYRVLHFATHGLLDDRQPELSGLVFSLVDPEGRPRRGFLRLHEIYNLDLTAELVVLSACQTGVGREIRGEGLLSLTRGFMYAGVPRVVMSLWKVEDRSTAELMSRFYFQLLEKGELPAAALRAAQISMWREEEWSDPIHWAGFVFQGDYGEIPGGIEAKEAGGTGVDDRARNDLPIPDPPRRSRYGLTGRFRYFNGVNGATGRYLTPPMTASELAEMAGRERLSNLPLAKLPSEIVEYLKRLLGVHGLTDLRRAPIANIARPWDLSETGWGVIFGPDVKASVKEAVRGLLEYRKDQAGGSNRLVKVEEYQYRKGETTAQFLQRHGVNPSMADTERFPFYLLLVGDPESLPYTFQYELDVQYAVGRIYFEDPSHFKVYVDSIKNAEGRRPVRRPRQITFFGTRNELDRATQRTVSELVEPLAATVLEPGMPWEVRRVLGNEARKSRLKRLLGGDETPGLLFTATHGVGFPNEDERQADQQGALVCQDWEGPDRGIDEDRYFSAADLVDDASVHGLIAFFFACHSAGTPIRDNFGFGALRKPQQIAPAALVSRLPQRLLSHPRGGALAVIGHVDRAWTTSFEGSDQGEGLDVYRACLRNLLSGHTIGWSMQLFNQAYAALAAQLDTLWQGLHWKEDVDLEWLASLWGTSNDVRNFVVFGDPAVRLPGAPTPRPLRR